jgi:sulfonate transport system permease protein
MTEVGPGAMVAAEVAEADPPAAGAPAPALSPTVSGVAPAPAREVFVAADARRVSALTRWRKRLSWPLGIYTTPVAILIIWQVLAEAGLLSPTAAPAPSVIARTAGQLWQQGVLGPDLEISLLHRALVGFVLGLSVGVITGVLGGLLRSGEYLFNGVVQIFNTIPILAILPVMIVWFGIDETPKILIIAFGAFVPMYLNLFAAIRGVDQRLVEMARTTGAGRWRLLTRVMFPGALPGFLVGLRFSLAYSILGLVAAETLNANSGIGFLITNGQTYMQPDQVWVGLVIYAILGLLADQFVRLLQRVLLRWRPSYEVKAGWPQGRMRFFNSAGFRGWR